MKNAIVLLSGGLDSLVVLGYPQKKYQINLALTFDYGQKSAKQEIIASRRICEYYNVEHKVITLEWLKDITHSALVSESSIPTHNLGTYSSAKAVWVPNRNGLFLNIAAAYADAYEFDYILFGANKDESTTFPDNTEEFRCQISETFKTSTLQQPVVLAPLINYTKNDIVKIAIENGMPLQFVRSCYGSGDKHCGKCESCLRLKRALELNDRHDIINLLFD